MASAILASSRSLKFDNFHNEPNQITAVLNLVVTSLSCNLHFFAVSGQSIGVADFISSNTVASVSWSCRSHVCMSAFKHFFRIGYTSICELINWEHWTLLSKKYSVEMSWVLLKHISVPAFSISLSTGLHFFQNHFKVNEKSSYCW